MPATDLARSVGAAAEFPGFRRQMKPRLLAPAKAMSDRRDLAGPKFVTDAMAKIIRLVGTDMIDTK